MNYTFTLDTEAITRGVGSIIATRLSSGNKYRYLFSARTLADADAMLAEFQAAESPVVVCQKYNLDAEKLPSRR